MIETSSARQGAAKRSALSAFPVFDLPGMLVLLWAATALGQVAAEDSAAFFDFRRGMGDQANLGYALRGMEAGGEEGLVFEGVLETAETTEEHLAAIAEKLDGVEAMSVGGWFYGRRWGEQAIFSRGLPRFANLGERFFRPSDEFVKFVLGMDHRGFFCGTINGNGRMPFVHVTANEVPVHTWNQLVVVKTAEGHHRFYRNGTLVHTDRRSAHAPNDRPFRERESVSQTPRIRLRMPMGGRIGEAWIVPRALSDEDVRADYEAKKGRYAPAPPGEMVKLRPIHRRPRPEQWQRRIASETWPGMRKEIRGAALEIMGTFPEEKVSLKPEVLGEEDMGGYVRRKVSIRVQEGDRMPAYLLIPKDLPEPAPAIICFYGTTAGAGKTTTVGLSGRKPGSEAHPNYAFAVDMVEAGFVALAADYLRDGERLPPSGQPYDTSAFYERHPDWSIVGKDVWDNRRVVDYLQSLDFVDGERIGMVGHSYGGHSTIFAASMEPRIKAAVANGPVSAFREHGMHWAAPKGGGASQSLPGMRPYILDPSRPLPIHFYEWTALIAPRPLLVGHAIGERRPRVEENHAAVAEVYEGLGHGEKVKYLWYPGDHDFPPAMRQAAVQWFKRWLRSE